ncbi:MAG: hypothetical protein ACRER5_20655 [Pseudomonas sp.]
MTQPQKQRQVRFSRSDDARVEAQALALGMTVPVWMKSVLLRALDEAGAAEVVREELHTAQGRSEKQLAELKAFLFEALVGLGERIKQSQEDFLQELGGQLPQQGSRKADLSEFFPTQTKGTNHS